MATKNDDNIVIKEASKSKMESANKEGTISKFFGFKKFNTTFKKEIVGGISTLLAMIYILSVEPGILSGAQSITGEGNMNFHGIFLVTAIMAFSSTFVMGMFANIPVALAPSMGVNAMFTFNVANQGVGFEGALICTMISSILFCAISISKFRQTLIKSLPKSMHLAIGIGIGFFIAYVGVANIGWVEKAPSGLPIASLSHLESIYPAIIVGTVVIFAALILHFKKFVAPIALTMLVGFIITVILANTIESDVIKNSFGSAVWNSDNWNYALLGEGFVDNITAVYKQFGNVDIWTNPTMYVSMFVFLILTFFDATGTLTAVNVEMGKGLSEPREIPKASMIIDGASSTVGGMLGVSHMAVYAESCVGVSQGAKTGFASIITSIGLLLSVLLFPIFQMIPSCISGAATLFIGVIMISNIAEIEWNKPEISTSTFFIILFMIITYNIANGIAMGMISYSIVSLATKKGKKVHSIIWVLDVFFIAYFIAYAFIQ